MKVRASVDCRDRASGIRLVAGQAEARRDLNVARSFDLMLPIPFKPLLKYLRRGSLVNFGKLLEGKRGGHTHDIRINGL